MNFNLVVQYRWFTQEQDLFDAHQILRNGQAITPKRGGNPSPGLMPASKLPNLLWVLTNSGGNNENQIHGHV
jgi:hypothetical protein